MNNVMIVTPTKKSADMLVSLLHEGGHEIDSIRIASSGSEARRAMLEHNFELILVNSPMPDEFGHEFAAYAAASGKTAVVMMVKSDLADSVAAQLEPDGIFILAKPISRPLFHQIIRVAAATRIHIMALQQENRKLRQKLDDMRAIGRAKCLLIQEKHLTEAEAHSYIEKNAMNHRKSRREIAEIIIQNFD